VYNTYTVLKHFPLSQLVTLDDCTIKLSKVAIVPISIFVFQYRIRLTTDPQSYIPPRGVEIRSNHTQYLACTTNTEFELMGKPLKSSLVFAFSASRRENGTRIGFLQYLFTRLPGIYISLFSLYLLHSSIHASYHCILKKYFLSQLVYGVTKLGCER